MPEQQVHHGREHASTAIALIVEYLSVKYGIIWLAWAAVFFALLSVWGYTKKVTQNKPRVGWGLRASVCLVVVVCAVIVMRNRAHKVGASSQTENPPKVQFTGEDATRIGGELISQYYRQHPDLPPNPPSQEAINYVNEHFAQQGILFRWELPKENEPCAKTGIKIYADQSSINGVHNNACAETGVEINGEHDKIGDITNGPTPKAKPRP